MFRTKWACKNKQRSTWQEDPVLRDSRFALGEGSRLVKNNNSHIVGPL